MDYSCKGTTLPVTSANSEECEERCVTSTTNLPSSPRARACVVYMMYEVIHGWEEKVGTLDKIVKKAWTVHGTRCTIAPPWLQAI